MSNALKISTQGGVHTITLSRPDVRNAFNDEVIAELKNAFLAVAQDPAVRCVVLAAEGPAFCAGADLNWMRRMADYTRGENLADAGELAAMLRAIYECLQPTIARVQGDVYAGGMGLVAACDMAVSVDTANYCLSEVKLGLIPATISPYVIRAMGERAASRYFLSAERFDAAEAYRIGFVHDICLPAELDGRVNDMLGHLILGGARAIEECKKLIQLSGGTKLTPAVRAETARRSCPSLAAPCPKSPSAGLRHPISPLRTLQVVIVRTRCVVTRGDPQKQMCRQAAADLDAAAHFILPPISRLDSRYSSGFRVLSGGRA
jgi:methylglutaconyl-CoA hydratase